MVALHRSIFVELEQLALLLLFAALTLCHRPWTANAAARAPFRGGALRAVRLDTRSAWCWLRNEKPWLQRGLPLR